MAGWLVKFLGKSIGNVRIFVPVGWRPENEFPGAVYTGTAWFNGNGPYAVLGYQGDPREKGQVSIDAEQIVVIRLSDDRDIGPIEMPWSDAVSELAEKMQNESELSVTGKAKPLVFLVRMHSHGFDIVERGGEVWASGTSRRILSYEQDLLKRVRQVMAQRADP